MMENACKTFTSLASPNALGLLLMMQKPMLKSAEAIMPSEARQKHRGGG